MDASNKSKDGKKGLSNDQIILQNKSSLSKKIMIDSIERKEFLNNKENEPTENPRPSVFKKIPGFKNTISALGAINSSIISGEFNPSRRISSVFYGASRFVNSKSKSISESENLERNPNENDQNEENKNSGDQLNNQNDNVFDSNSSNKDSIHSNNSGYPFAPIDQIPLRNYQKSSTR